MAIVYQHRRKDTNEVFYIGKGKVVSRAYSKSGRNRFWKNVVNKVGYEVDILIQGCTLDEACEVEKGMIESYGKLYNGTGILVNLADGGDKGATGYKKTAEQIEKTRSALKGKPRKRIQTAEVNAKISATLTGRKNPEHGKKMKGRPAWNKGLSHSDEHKENLKKAWVRRKQRAT
jgi:hypothetical protein